MILLAAVLLGIFLGIFLPYNLSSDTLPYVAVALIAALDSVFGGAKSYLKKRFNINIFVSGFFTNALLAVFLTYVGNKLGLNLSFAVIVVFGSRIFGNTSEIRHLILDKMAMERERKRRREHRRMLAIEGSATVKEEELDSPQEKDAGAEKEPAPEEETVPSETEAEKHETGGKAENTSPVRKKKKTNTEKGNHLEEKEEK